MNRYLDSLTLASGVAVRLGAGAPDAVAPQLVEPDVQFGCITELGLPADDCQPRGDSALGRGKERMRLAVTRPSPSWITWMGSSPDAHGAGRVLILRLEVGSYLVRERGVRGREEVELGTGHSASVPRLTALETPVQVLQLTGALVGRDGRAVRIGAEGILAKRSRLLVSAVGGVERLGEDAVSAARAGRRDDLPGTPLAWQVAMRQLVAQLTGRPEVAR
jgi:hypothetical protein